MLAPRLSVVSLLLSLKQQVYDKAGLDVSPAAVYFIQVLSSLDSTSFLCCKNFWEDFAVLDIIVD